MTGHIDNVMRHLRRAVLGRDAGLMTDGQLLESFLVEREEATFEALVRRHGPMVMGVCRRMLDNAQDAEDAFQATFLVLIRKAASLLPRQTIGNWLYGVAYHTALKAREGNWKRRAKEKQVRDMPRPEATENAWHDLQPLLDQELSRLPDKYREAVVLCDLEGKTRREAARKLGIPEGTLSGRLTTARRILAKRLARRGVTLSGGALAAVLAQNAASAGVPGALVVATAKTASALATGSAMSATAISAKVAALTEGVLKAMLLTKLKIAVVLLAVMATVIGLGSTFTYGLLAGQTGDLKKGNQEQPPQAGGKKETAEKNEPSSTTAVPLISVSSPIGGIIVALLVKREDAVKEGAVLARLDDRKAMLEVEAAEVKLDNVKAEAAAAEAAREEAELRAKTAEELFMRKVISREEYQTALATRNKLVAEGATRRGTIKFAQVEIKKMELHVDQHVIRSPVAGTVRVLLKNKGEAIGELGILLKIEPGPKRPPDKQDKAKPEKHTTFFYSVSSPIKGIIVDLLANRADSIQEGAVLARLDDRKAKLEVEAAEAKLNYTKAELKAMTAVSQEAEIRAKTAEELFKRKVIAREDYQAALATRDKLVAEVAARRGAVKLAQIEVKLAELYLDQHVIRSPVAGTVRALFKHKGEAIGEREKLLLIEGE